MRDAGVQGDGFDVGRYQRRDSPFGPAAANSTIARGRRVNLVKRGSDPACFVDANTATLDQISGAGCLNIGLSPNHNGHFPTHISWKIRRGLICPPNQVYLKKYNGSTACRPSRSRGLPLEGFVPNSEWRQCDNRVLSDLVRLLIQNGPGRL